jgi:hypothetical protein
MANWTPESFIGQLFKTIGKYVAPVLGMKSSALWGDKAYLDILFGSKATVAARVDDNYRCSKGLRSNSFTG